MAYTLNKDPFLLKSGNVYIGAWTSPSAIVPGTDPETSFTPSGGTLPTSVLGYYEMGTLKAPVARQYASFYANVPHILVRKDLIQKDFHMEAQLAQWSSDLLGLVQGLDVDAGTYTLAWIGPDEPTQVAYGYLIKTFLTDATPFNIAIWNGLQTGETQGFGPDGSKHNTYQMKIQAVPGDDFEANPDDTHSYGMYWYAQTPS